MKEGYTITMKESNLSDTYEYIVYVIVAALHPSTVKTLFAVIFIAVSFLFDLNQSSSLIALFVLILIDFITGISAAKYLGEPIRSSKIKHTAIKVTAYFAVIAGAQLAEHGLVDFLAVIDETVIAFFLLTELISLLENVGRLGIQTPQKLLNQLRDTKKKL